MCLLCLMPVICPADTGAAGDLGTVVRVNEYVTLREMPKRKAAEIAKMPLNSTFVYLGETDDDFSYVSYQGQCGYALSEYLKQLPVEKGTPIEPDDVLKIRLNLFLTNFSARWFDSGAAFVFGEHRDREMVDFAVDMLFADSMEYGEWGDFNARVNGSRIPEMVARWFGVPSVNVTDTRYDYHEGFYYSDETGGRSNGGFVIVDRVELLENDRSRISFTVYGTGEDWKPEAVCTLSANRASAMYPDIVNRSGTAVIRMNGQTADETQWTLEYWIVKTNE